MSEMSKKDRFVLEMMLVLISVGIACLLYLMQGYKGVILYLFFLPVILGSFFLGRYQGGVLALFCVLSASAVSVLKLTEFSATLSPLIAGLGIVVWAAVLALAAILLGTVADDRAKKIKELHEAYVGVVEVLSQYLQSANPGRKPRSIRVAQLSRQVAVAMKLTPRQIDDIRLAALLYDMGNIEVTTRVIRRAVGAFEENVSDKQNHTFQGMDLMLSLGSVLSGAVPLLLNQGQGVLGHGPAAPAEADFDPPVGARIIHAVRAYLAMLPDGPEQSEAAIDSLFQRLREDQVAPHDPHVLDVLRRVVSRAEASPQHEEEVVELAVG
jgi:hypothetical protein